MRRALHTPSGQRPGAPICRPKPHNGRVALLRCRALDGRVRKDGLLRWCKCAPRCAAPRGEERSGGVRGGDDGGFAGAAAMYPISAPMTLTNTHTHTHTHTHTIDRPHSRRRRRSSNSSRRRSSRRSSSSWTPPPPRRSRSSSSQQQRTTAPPPPTPTRRRLAPLALLPPVSARPPALRPRPMR